jgi:O-antigen ligase
MSVLLGAVVAILGEAGYEWVVPTLLAAGVAIYLLARVARPAASVPSTERPSFPLAITGTFMAGLATAGLLVLRPGGALSVSDLLFVASYGLCVAYLLRGHRPTRVLSPWVGIGVCIFAVGALASSAGAAGPAESASILLRFAFVAWGLVWLGAQVIRDWDQMRFCATAWAAGGALTASGAVLSALLGGDIPGTGMAWGRMTGFTQNVNDLGGVCAVAIPVSVCLAVDASGKRRRGSLYLVAIAALTISGLVLSASIGGLAASLIGLLVAALSIRWSGGLGVAIAAASVAGAVLVLAFGVGADMIERYGVVTGPAGDPSATFWTRLEAIWAAWHVIQAQPLVGVGLAAGGAVTESGHAVHNVLVAAWYQAGMLGLLGIVILLGNALAEGARAIARVPRVDEARNVLAGIVGSLTAALVLGLSAPVLYQRYFWVPIVLVIAASAMTRVPVSANLRPSSRRSVSRA